MADKPRKKKSTSVARRDKSRLPDKKRKPFNVFKDLARVKARVDELQGGNFYKLKFGQNWFYIMRREDQPVLVERSVHGYLICPKVHLGEDCIGCKRVRKADKAGDKKFVKDWRLKATGHFLALPKNKIKDFDVDDVKPVKVSPGVLNKMCEDMMTGHFDPTDPEEARPICITKRKTDTIYGVEYEVSFGEDRDVSDYITDEIRNELPVLDDHNATQAATNKEIREAMDGKGGGKKRRGLNVKTRDDIADDQVDDDEFEDDELDDEPETGDGESEFEDDTDIGEDDDEPAEEDEVFDKEDGDLDGELSEEEEAELLGDDEPEPAPAPKKPRRKRRRKPQA